MEIHLSAAVTTVVFLLLSVCNALPPRQEIEALEEFKESLGADTQWNSSNVCNWAGIGCDTSQQHVVTIDLSMPLLSFQSFGARLSPLLGNLSHLERLKCSFLGLGGVIPSTLGQLTHLQVLDLSDNLLTGAIPHELGGCSRLKVLDLSGNSFEGAIPQSLCQLSQLEELQLENNFNLHSFPAGFMNLKLRVLHLDLMDNITFIAPDSLKELSVLSHWIPGDQLRFCNNLTSLRITLPNTVIEWNWLGHLHNLEMLALSNDLPRETDISVTRFFSDDIVANLSKLTYLSIHLGLQGHIPSSLLAIPSLETLDLSGNQFNSVQPSNNTSIQIKDLNLEDNILTLSDFHNLINMYVYSRGNLQKLDMSSNRLAGAVPNGLTDFTNISSLNLSNNSLEGNISWASKLLNLEALDLSRNRFNGLLPADLTELLVDLRLDHNNFYGPIPSSQAWLGLQILDLSHNYQLSGTIPDFRKILRIDISHNQLTGPIPHFNSTNLSSLSMSHNKFNGFIPTSVCGLKNIRFILLSHNVLKGNIPKCITNLNYLQVLDLSNNQLSGILPGNLSQLKFFVSMDYATYALYDDSFTYSKVDLDVNDLKSEYNTLAIQINNMFVFDVSNNVLTGEIPPELGLLVATTHLNLSFNQFTGHIPPQLGALTELQSIDFQHNHLDGTIPAELCNIPRISTLHFSHNNLTGSVPPCYSYMETKYPESSFEDNAGLCGYTRQKTCVTTRNSPPIQDNVDNGNGDDTLWHLVYHWPFYLGLVAGFYATLLPTLFPRTFWCLPSINLSFDQI